MNRRYILRVASLAFVALTCSTAASALELCPFGSEVSSRPNGPEYPLVNTSYKYGLSSTDYTRINEYAYFFSSQGHAVTVKFQFDGLRIKADASMKFKRLGQTAVSVEYPDHGVNISECNIVWVQSAPSISKISLNTNNRTAIIRYKVSEFSKAGRTSTPVTVNFRWKSDFYGTSGSLGTKRLNPLEGTVTQRFSVPAKRDLYHITATVQDGTYTKAVSLGSYFNKTGGGGGRPIN